MNPANLKERFIIRYGLFHQPYRSLRLKNCEITIDNLIPNYFTLSIATPYKERLDKIKHREGAGAGEVKRCWYFTTEEKVFNFIAGHGIIEE